MKGESDIELLMTMLEGVMQTQELVVMSLLRAGVLDASALTAMLEHASSKKELHAGTQFPLDRMLEVVAGRQPQPPRWKPRLIPGGRDD
jgi:hypothetical protein